MTRSGRARRVRAFGLLTVALALAAGGAATAAPITTLGSGGQLFVPGPGADVAVNILASDSGFSNAIGLYTPDPNNSTAFNLVQGIGQDEQTGVSVSGMGPFAAGTELVLGITTNEGTPHTYFMGPGARNPDGAAHGILSAVSVDGQGFGTYKVKFEDLFNLGDADFNDAVVQVTLTPHPVAAQAVPEPTSLALWGLTGLAGAAARWYSRRRPAQG